tara:strand:- start:666 stop:1151 length:486 start_codon:yes stop_codon:yes gene_type:complete
MKEIQLTQGKVALVDDEDYDYLMQWKWFANKKGSTFYAVRSLHSNNVRKTIFMHRLITNNINTKMQTDHLNGNGLDNRKINLRICTTSQNSMNRGLQINNTTGFKGVNYDKFSNKFRAQIRVNNIYKNLGYYIDPKDAARAYNEAAIKLHGEFANLNKIEI